jgi:hypothetical protein
MSQCASSYRSLYTPQQGINPDAIITSRDVREILGRDPIGVVRDSYNHACFLLFMARSGIRYARDMPMVPLPIVDDGSFYRNMRLYLDIEDFTPAPADIIITYYREKLSKIIDAYPGYAPESLATSVVKDNQVIAIRLKNGIYIPARPPTGAVDIKSAPIEGLEWDLNRKLAKPCGSIS